MEMKDKYYIDGHKLLWHLDRVVKWQINPVICPIYMEISPISSCNHRCIFCGVDFARRNKILNVSSYVKFIKFLSREGLKSVMIAGEGEPLLHKRIEEIIFETRRAGIDVALVTNGSLAIEEKMKPILPSLTWIRFSLDAGSENIYSLVHNVDKKEFFKVIKNIDNCCKIKEDLHLNITIGVQYLVVDENYNDIENAINLLSSLKIDYFVLKPFSLHPQMKNKLSVEYSLKKLECIEEIINKSKCDFPIIFRKESFKKYILMEKDYNHCYALSFWGHLTAEGDFYTCSIFIGDNRFMCGNINEKAPYDIIYGKRRKESIYWGAKELDVAKECRINCRMARINEFLELLQNTPEHVNFI